MCRLHDCVSNSGMATAAHSGGAKGLAPVKRLALPMKASASLGKVSMLAHALAWISTRVRELAAIARKVERGHLISPAADRQWHARLDKVTAEPGLPSIIRKLGAEWEEKIALIRDHVLGRDTIALERVCEVAYATAEKIKLQHFEDKSVSWKVFLEKQLISGSAAAHRFVKRGSRFYSGATTVGEGNLRSAPPPGSGPARSKGVAGYLGKTRRAPHRAMAGAHGQRGGVAGDHGRRCP